MGKDVDSSPTEFIVYEEAIAQLSQPLRSLLAGDLSESLTECIIWPDVSKETFGRFVQFAYTGDYSIPSPIRRTGVTAPEMAGTDTPNTLARLDASNGVQGLEEPAKENSRPLPASTYADEVLEDDWGFFSTKKSKKKSVKSTRAHSEPNFAPDTVEEIGQEIASRREPYPTPRSPQLPTKLDLLSYPLSAPRNNYENKCEPSGRFKKGRSYANVFLSHATLFVLADYHLVDSLKDLSMFKLHKTLCVFELDGDNTVDIIDLARYAYSDEGRGSDEGVGRLRGLICQFMAENALILSSDAAFEELLSEGGQLTLDLFKFTVQLIRS